MKKALVFGGNGFLGLFVVQELCKQNFEVLVLGRNKKNFDELKVSGFPGQVAFKQIDISDASTINKIKFKNFNLAINLVGIGEEIGKNSYHAVHNNFPSRLANLTYKENIDFIHVSAFTGEENSNSKYINSKRESENLVIKNHPNAIIIRPSLIIGNNSPLISLFERTANLIPFFLPMPNIGKIKIQPVFAGDVAEFIVKCYNNPQMQGKTFNLAGSETILFKNFVLKILGFMNKTKFFIPVPFVLVTTLLKLKKYIPKFIFNTNLTADIFALSKKETTIKENHITLLINKPQKIDETLKNALFKYKLYD